MIAEHQPTLHPDLLIAVSSRDDGSMKTGKELMDAKSVDSRERFLGRLGTDGKKTVLQKVTYADDRTYDVIRKVEARDAGRTIEADALYTCDQDLPILLPLADCVGVVMYHPDARLMAVLHSGRHSTFADLSEKVLDLLTVQENVDPSRLLVWLSPAVSRESYRLKWFDLADSERWRDFYDYDGQDYFLDLPGFIRAQCLAAGVQEQHIHMPVTDTAVDERYYSHSQGDTNARFAILAMMR